MSAVPGGAVAGAAAVCGAQAGEKTPSKGSHTRRRAARSVEPDMLAMLSKAQGKSTGGGETREEKVGWSARAFLVRSPRWMELHSR